MLKSMTKQTAMPQTTQPARSKYDPKLEFAVVEVVVVEAMVVVRVVISCICAMVVVRVVTSLAGAGADVGVGVGAGVGAGVGDGVGVGDESFASGRVASSLPRTSFTDCAAFRFPDAGVTSEIKHPAAWS
jgi:hypothetical protein